VFGNPSELYLLTISWFHASTDERTGPGRGGCGTANGCSRVNDTVVPSTFRFE